MASSRRQGAQVRPGASYAALLARPGRRRWLYVFAGSLVAHALLLPILLPRLLIERSDEIEVAYLPDITPSESRLSDDDSPAQEEPKLKPPDEKEAPEPDRRATAVAGAPA